MDAQEWRHLDFSTCCVWPCLHELKLTIFILSFGANSARKSILWSFPCLSLRLTVSMPLCEPLRSVPWPWVLAPALPGITLLSTSRTLWMVQDDIILLRSHCKKHDGPSVIALSPYDCHHLGYCSFTFLLIVLLSFSPSKTWCQSLTE